MPVGEYLLLAAQGAIVFHAQQPAGTAITADFTHVTGAAVAPDQALAPPVSPSGTVRQLVSWLANRIRAITGAAGWWDAPATTLAAANAHYPATTGVHGVGASTVESVAGAQSKVDTHVPVTTGIHGVGTSTVESIAGAQSKVDAHAALTTAHSAVSAATASRIIIRDAAGRAQVVDGAVAADIATRGQVDTHAGLTTGVHGVGASTVESVAGAQAKVDTHAGRVDNPHVVTAVQAGAVRNDGGDTLRGGLIVTPITSPAAPTVSVQGTAGTTTYGYRVTARSRVGETLASPETTITTGNATLSATNFNRITWTAVPGAVDYRVWRTFSGGTPATTGVIATTAVLTVDDTGLAAAGVIPTTDTSGNVGIGTGSPHASSIFELSSTTQGFLPPRLTTAQRDAIPTPPDGLMIYNVTIPAFQGRQAGAWVNL
ncbi:MAG: hypothetical protein DDT37_01979 [Firmicutes bacterium]|nr:hypothetical protein [candidate division NPL-UPA2 bacterium]